MVDLILRDYAAWKIENHEIIENFQKNNNIIYTRLEPVFLVLNHIYDIACEEPNLDEDYATIFEVGFNYLNSQFNVIKIYFESLFQSDCDEFGDYSNALLYLIYIYDIKNDIENNEVDIDFGPLDEIETEIENLIMDRGTDFLVIEAKLKVILDDLNDSMSYEYVSIIDIFENIADSLGISYIEEEEYIIGTDI